MVKEDYKMKNIEIDNKESTMVDYLIKQNFYDYIPQIIQAYEDQAGHGSLFDKKELEEITEYGTELVDNYFPMNNHSLKLRTDKDRESFNAMVGEFVMAFLGMLNEAMRAMMTTVLLNRAIPDVEEE